jgi:AraC family transcriptional regulator
MPPPTRPSAVLTRLLPAERLLFEGDVACAGTFDCGTADPTFAGGEPSTSHCLVFSRTPVWIQHDAGIRYVADATRITLHNQGRAYRRWKIDERGDHCSWLAFAGDVVAAAIGRRDPGRFDRDAAWPFTHPFVPATERIYLRQWQLFDRLATVRPADRLEIEEEAIALLDAVAKRIYAEAPPARAGNAAARRNLFEAVQAVRERMAVAPAAAPPLRLLAGSVALSPYALCRAFRQLCGETLTAYRTRLRILGSLDAVRAGGDLTSVALDWGFASHSHFTWAFRKTFGVPPSAVRGAGTRKVRTRETSRRHPRLELVKA